MQEVRNQTEIQKIMASESCRAFISHYQVRFKKQKVKSLIFLMAGDETAPREWAETFIESDHWTFWKADSKNTGEILYLVVLFLRSRLSIRAELA